MSRRANKVVAAAVFVVVFYSLIPVSSGADFNATAPAKVTITIQIPETTPTSAAPVDEQLDAEPSPDTVPAQEPEQLSSPDAAPPVQPEPVVATPAPEPTPDPIVVNPTPEPVVVPELSEPVVADPVVTSDPAPLVSVANPILQPEMVVVEVAPEAAPETELSAQESPAPLEPEGSINEEVSP